MISISDGLDPYFFRRKMEKTRSMKEEVDGEVFVLRRSRHFSFIDKMIKVRFRICTLNWRLINYVSRQGKGLNRRNESTISIIRIVAFGILLIFEFIDCLFALKIFPHN